MLSQAAWDNIHLGPSHEDCKISTRPYLLMLFRDDNTTTNACFRWCLTFEANLFFSVRTQANCVFCIFAQCCFCKSGDTHKLCESQCLYLIWFFMKWLHQMLHKHIESVTWVRLIEQDKLIWFDNNEVHPGLNIPKAARDTVKREGQ